MEKAARWSLGNNNQGQDDNAVPVTSSRLDDVVQRDIVERVRETPWRLTQERRRPGSWAIHTFGSSQ